MANLHNVIELYQAGYYENARDEALQLVKAEPKNALAHHYLAACCYVLFNSRDDDSDDNGDNTNSITLSRLVQAFCTHSKISTQLNSSELRVYDFRLYLAQKCEGFQPWLATDAVIDVAELQFLKEKFILLDPKNRNISQCDIEIGLRNNDLGLVCTALQFQIDDSRKCDLPRQQNDMILADLYCKLGHYQAHCNELAAAFASYQQAVDLCTRNYEAIAKAGLTAHMQKQPSLAYAWWFYIFTNGAFDGNMQDQTTEHIWAMLKADIAHFKTQNTPIPKDCLHSFFELAINTDFDNKPINTRYADLTQLCKSQLEKHPQHDNAQYLLARSYALNNQDALALPYYLVYTPKHEDLPFFQARFLLTYFAVHRDFPHDFTPYLAGENALEYYNTAVMLGADEGYINDNQLTATQRLRRNQIQQLFYEKSMALFADYFDNNLGSAANNDAHCYAMCCHNLAIIYSVTDTKLGIKTELKSVQYSEFEENITTLIRLYNLDKQPNEAKKWSEHYYGNGLNELLEKGVSVSPIGDENTENSGFNPYIMESYFIDYAGGLRQTGEVEKALEFIQLGISRYDSLGKNIQAEIEAEHHIYGYLITHLAQCQQALQNTSALIKTFSEALKTQPNNLLLYNNLGYYGYHQHQDFVSALRVYSTGIDKAQSGAVVDDYNYALLLENCAQLNFYAANDASDHLRNYRAVLPDAEILISLKPSHKIAYWYAAYSCLMLSEESADMLTEGLDFIAKYEQLTLDTQSNLNLIAGALFHRNQLHLEAVIAFEKAFASFPEPKNDAYYADLYQQSKSQSEKSVKTSFFTNLFKK